MVVVGAQHHALEGEVARHGLLSRGLKRSVIFFRRVSMEISMVNLLAPIK